MKRALAIAATLLALALGLLAAVAWTEAEAGCQTKACWGRVHDRRVWDQCVERHGARACTFRRRWRALPAWRRSYIAALFRCEAGRLDNADGSDFQLRGEWTWSTWRSAGGRGTHPTYEEEGVIVHRWLLRVGHHSTAGWPRCP